MDRVIAPRSRATRARRGGYALAAAAVAASGLAGAATVARAAPEETVTIWLDEAFVDECVLDLGFRSFDDDTATAEPELLPEAWDAIRTSISGGAGPDVVITPGPSFAYELAQAGAFVPLDDYVSELGLDESFVDWALELGTIDGTTYSVPSELETIVLYYNATLFEEQGWEVPTTIDELEALAEEVAAAGIIPFSHANAEWRPANEWHISALFNAYAGPDAVYAALTGEKSFADPEFVEAVELLDRFQQEGYFSGGLDRYYSLTFDETMGAMGSGEAAMVVEGSWALEDINNFFGEEAGNDNRWDWAPVPSASGDPTFAIGVGSTYSINAASSVPDAAARLIAHVFAPETQATLAAECGIAPAPVRVESSMFAGLDERNAGIYAAIADASDAGDYGYLTWTFWPPRSDVYIYEELERVWDGQITAQEYADGLAELFAEELEEGAIPPLPARG